MPTYEFTCKDCKYHFETFMSISKKGSIQCPKCHSGSLQESYGAFYLGGDLANPRAGNGCDGSCATCSSACKR